MLPMENVQSLEFQRHVEWSNDAARYYSAYDVCIIERAGLMSPTFWLFTFNLAKFQFFTHFHFDKCQNPFLRYNLEYIARKYQSNKLQVEESNLSVLSVLTCPKSNWLFGKNLKINMWKNCCSYIDNTGPQKQWE